MVKIVIENLGKKNVVVNDSARTVLGTFQDQRIDWMQGCGGKGRCTTCKMIVVEGSENISPLSEAELRYRKINALGDSERLTCQVKVTGDILIRVPDEYKLPHVVYHG